MTKPALNKKAVKFITEKLIPFMQREHGNGFAMQVWQATPTSEYNSFIPNGRCQFDGIERPVPPCNTVACIGGSIEHLTGKKNSLHKYLGITDDQAYGLFQNWDEDSSYEFCWPKKFSDRFADADTPRKKAAVAVALLKQIVLKGGDILKNPNYSEPY